MIEPVTSWFEIKKYYDKQVETLEVIVEQTWIDRYPRPTEITYGCGENYLGMYLIIII